MPSQRQTMTHGGTRDTTDRNLKIVEHGARRELAGQCSDPRPADRRTIARDIHTRPAAPIPIRVRQPLAECRVVAKFDTREIGKLRLRLEPEAIRNSITRNDMLAAIATAETDAFDAVCAGEGDKPDSMMDRHVRAPKCIHVPEPARESLRRGQ